MVIAKYVKKGNLYYFETLQVTPEIWNMRENRVDKALWMYRMLYQSYLFLKSNYSSYLNKQVTSVTTTKYEKKCFIIPFQRAEIKWSLMGSDQDYVLSMEKVRGRNLKSQWILTSFFTDKS